MQIYEWGSRKSDLDSQVFHPVLCFVFRGHFQEICHLPSPFEGKSFNSPLWSAAAGFTFIITAIIRKLTAAEFKCGQDNTRSVIAVLLRFLHFHFYKQKKIILTFWNRVFLVTHKVINLNITCEKARKGSTRGESEVADEEARKGSTRGKSEVSGEEARKGSTRDESEVAGEEARKWGIYPGFETQSRCHQKSKTGVSVAPRKGLMSSRYFCVKNSQNFWWSSGMMGGNRLQFPLKDTVVKTI